MSYKNSVTDKSKRWAFTAWDLPQCVDKRISYLVWGEEKTLSGKIHYQGYVEFTDEITFKGVKRLLKCHKMHLSIARECRERNLLYCLKLNGAHLIYNKDAGVRGEQSEPQQVEELEGSIDYFTN